MMIVENKYDLGQFVYLKTDIEQKQRLVTQIGIMPNGLRYCLSCGAADTWHWDVEISAERDTLVAAGVEKKAS